MISIFCEKILGLQRKPISHANKITIFTFSAAPKQQAHFHDRELDNSKTKAEEREKWAQSRLSRDTII